MYGVVRRYTDAAVVFDGIVQSRADIEELLRGVPGCGAYYAIHEGGASAPTN